MSKIVLPKVYKNEGGKYPQHEGKYKVSYSQITSFKDYKAGYIQDYILGLGTGESGMFAEYGSACGTYLENLSNCGRLSKEDIEILSTVKRPEHAEYESEIVIDRGDYVIQGFLDQCYTLPAGLVINDFKTVSFKDRHKKYGDLDKYWQTRIYAYQKELEGHNIHKCGVIALGRKGNVRLEDTNESNKHNVLRLSGEIDYIPTPYIKKQVEKYLKSVDKTVENISQHYQTYLKIFSSN